MKKQKFVAVPATSDEEVEKMNQEEYSNPGGVDLETEEKLKEQFPANVEGSKEFIEANKDDNYESESPAETLEAVEKGEEEIMNFVMFGTNDKLVSDTFLNSLNETNHKVTIFELTSEEMRFIVNSRAKNKAEQTAVDYINSEESKEMVKDWVKTLSSNYIKSQYKRISIEELEKKMEEIISGETSIIFTRKTLKFCSGLSWKQFNELFSTMELMGVVKHIKEVKDHFTLVLDDSQLSENRMDELRELCLLVDGKTKAFLKKKEHFNEEQNKIMKSLSRRFDGIVKLF